MKNLLFIALVILGFSCCTPVGWPDQGFDIFVNNKSSDSILFVNKSFAYPDTTIPADFSSNTGVIVNQVRNLTSTHDWSDQINATSRDTISFFFFSKDTIDKYGWDDVKMHYRVLRRLDIGTHYLDSTGYTLTYP